MDVSPSSAVSLSPKRLGSPSPSRRPLTQRSDSDGNVPATPTIRVVADTGPRAYSKSPFPTLPSQILPLPPNVQGSTYEGLHGGNVSDEEHRSNTVDVGGSANNLFPEHFSKAKPIRVSASSTSSEVETVTHSSFFSSSGRTSDSAFSLASTTSDAAPDTFDDSIKLPALPEEPLTDGENVQFEPKTPEANDSTIRIVTPSTASSGAPLASKQSNNSLSSDATETLAASRRSDKSWPSRNWKRFPRPRQPEETPSTGSVRAEKASTRPVLFQSSESLASSASYSSGIDRPRSSSTPTSPSHSAALRAARNTGINIQYPIVRRPSASSSWAEVSNHASSSASKKPSSMYGGSFISPRYTSRLSTIPSESEHTSYSIDGTDRRSGSYLPPRRQTVNSFVSTEYSSSSDGSVPIPAPLFGGNRTGQAIQGRESYEGEDTLGELQSPPLRPQRSGLFSRLRPGSSDSLQSQSSQISFAGDLSWARDYYRRGETPLSPELSAASDSRLNTATSGVTQSSIGDNIPPSIHRPRNRPLQGERRPETAETQGSVAAQSERGSFFDRLTPVSVGVWSPHLMRDRRRSVMMYSPWQAPSLDEPFGSLFFGQVNRQIWLFCLGFILPVAWMFAAVLPIPRPPAEHLFASGFARASNLEDPRDQAYLQNASALDVAAMDEKRYQKARWWRILNRIMILPGIMLIAAMTALGVVASRMR